MSSHQVNFVREYIETVWNQGRTELADKYLAEDLIQHNPNLPDGRAPLVEFIDGFHKQYPRARFEIRRAAGSGDLVFLHTRFRGDPDDRGMVVVEVFRIDEGLIVEHWDVRDEIPETTVSGHEVV
ncbi:nuclear transport factor 2 family protein [Streptomyces sp. NPDC051987]|uniref:nuclear transport factor 2 family protein n=1 Tax=Streptomyces sp. NPDC051987 TaxID=3155808 RepID=UPI0034120703